MIFLAISHKILSYFHDTAFFAAKIQNSPLQVMLLVVKFIHCTFKRIKKKKERDKK